MKARAQEKGHIMVTVAAVLVVLLGFAALAIDVGVMSSARASAQRAADAAALAAAFAFVTRPDLSNNQAGIDAIKEYAIKTAASNKILGTTVTVAAGDVTVEFAQRRVTVQVNHTQNTFFARVLGENSANIRATAVAEASANAVGDRCTKPWFIPNTVLSDNTGNDAMCTACADGELLLDPSTGNLTTFATNWMAAQDALPADQNPRRFTIKPQNPQGALAPGQFFAIRLGTGSGANWYEENIASCPDEAVFCQQSYPSEPGNMVGPTRQGVNTLVNYNRDPNCNTCDRDTYVSVGRYRRPASQGGGIFPTSRSLVLSPIINVCTFCPGDPSGQATYTVIGFALVFIEGIQGNDVQARLIRLLGCSGGAGGGGSTTETGAFGVPVRLVRTS